LKQFIPVYFDGIDCLLVKLFHFTYELQYLLLLILVLLIFWAAHIWSKLVMLIRVWLVECGSGMYKSWAVWPWLRYMCIVSTSSFALSISWFWEMHVTLHHTILYLLLIFSPFHRNVLLLSTIQLRAVWAFLTYLSHFIFISYYWVYCF